MGKPMEIISLENFKSSRAMITVWEGEPPRPIAEVRKEAKVLNRFVSKLEDGTFNGKNYEEALDIIPSLATIVVPAVIESGLTQRLTALETYNNQTA